jgi:hypothetical protein
MKKLILFLVVFLLSISFSFSQNYIPDNSPLIGTWYLYSPKKKAGPEFIAESYKGITNFTLVPGDDAESEASGGRDKKTELFSYTMKFIAEWDGTKLTGKVTAASWDQTNKNLKISVPLVYDSKKDLVTIHINNAEYGDVNFVFKHNKY